MKLKIKMGIDLLMTALLLCLMAYQVTGQKLHEWFGTGMLVLFLLHNILNIRWYGSLFKGKYTLLRAMQTLINISVLISMLCLGFSGIVLSRHIFAGLPIQGPMATARTMHLAASYWGFVLMSIHLGFHWSMVLGLFRRLWSRKKTPATFVWLMRFYSNFLLRGTERTVSIRKILSPICSLNRSLCFLILNRVQFLYLQGISP